jgi:hypothetical protein
LATLLRPFGLCDFRLFLATLFRSFGLCDHRLFWQLCLGLLVYEPMIT